MFLNLNVEANDSLENFIVTFGLSELDPVKFPVLAVVDQNH